MQTWFTTSIKISFILLLDIFPYVTEIQYDIWTSMNLFTHLSKHFPFVISTFVLEVVLFIFGYSN